MELVRMLDIGDAVRRGEDAGAVRLLDGNPPAAIQSVLNVDAALGIVDIHDRAIRGPAHRTAIGGEHLPGAGRGGVPEELLRLRRAGREGLSGIDRGESYPAISARGGGGESGGTRAGAVFRGAGEVVRRCTRRRAVATLERIKEAPDRIGARGRGGRA